jgi:prepilin-type N-terminal cleavage/methylation domain-containing protein
MRRAFTMIELLVVISLIGLLLGGLAYSLRGTRIGSRDARRLADGLLIAGAIDQYAQANGGFYPTDPGNPTVSPVCATALTNLDTSTFPKNNIPKDPKPAQPSATCTTAANGYLYYSPYGMSPNQKTYAIEIALEGLAPNDQPSYIQSTSRVTNRNVYLLTGRSCSATCFR